MEDRAVAGTARLNLAGGARPGRFLFAPPNRATGIGSVAATATSRPPSVAGGSRVDCRGRLRPKGTGMAIAPDISPDSSRRAERATGAFPPARMGVAGFRAAGEGTRPDSSRRRGRGAVAGSLERATSGSPVHACGCGCATPPLRRSSMRSRPQPGRIARPCVPPAFANGFDGRGSPSAQLIQLPLNGILDETWLFRVRPKTPDLLESAGREPVRAGCSGREAAGIRHVLNVFGRTRFKRVSRNSKLHASHENESATSLRLLSLLALKLPYSGCSLSPPWMQDKFRNRLFKYENLANSGLFEISGQVRAASACGLGRGFRRIVDDAGTTAAPATGDQGESFST